MRPLLLLDVDGVLNPYGYSRRPAGYTEHELFAEDDEPVLVNPEHGIWISELVRVYDVTVNRLARNRPAAWIDDLHTPEARAWASGRGEPTLLVTIDPSTGLTRRSVDRALGWAVDL